MVSASPPSERKSAQKLSRKKKRYWRKGTRIEDVDQFQLEQQLRKPDDSSQKADSELFDIDRAPSGHVVITVDDDYNGDLGDDSKPCSIKLIPIRRTGVKRTKRQLKCHQNLQPDPAIAPVKIQGRVSKASVKQQRALLNRMAKRQQIADPTKTFPPKQRRLGASLKLRDVYERSNALTETSGYDMWDKTAARTLSGKVPLVRQRKRSSLPAVELPHPGASYNPTVSDHKELIRKEVSVEQQRLDSEATLERKLAPPSDQDIVTPEERLNEMRQGLDVDIDNTPSSDSEDEEQMEIGAETAKKQNRTRKTKKQRKKPKAETKGTKSKENDVFRVKTLRRELAQRDERIVDRSAKRLLRREERIDRPGRLAKTRFEMPDTDVKLTDELVGSLRELKPEGGTLTERWKSLQKRRLVEPTAPRSVKRKLKRKTFEKRGHKEVTIDSKVRN